MQNEAILAAAGIISIPILALGHKYFAGPHCHISRDLTDEVIIITGSSAGVGKEIARSLAKQNATIIFACRSAKKTKPVIESIRSETGNSKLEYIHLDFNELSTVKEFARIFKQKHSKLNVLVNNAGILGYPKRELSKDGIEQQFAVNFLGPFYLTNLLLDKLKATPSSRIVNVSSFGHLQGQFFWDDMMLEKNYKLYDAYGQSKLANVTYIKALQKKLDDSKVKAVSLNPGLVRSEGFRHVKESKLIKFAMVLSHPLFLYFGKSSEQGAQTALYCIMQDFEKLEGGGYYSDNKLQKANEKSEDEGNQKKIWEVAEKMIQDKVGSTW